EKLVAAWYISLPKSKELMSLIRLHLCNFDYKKKELYESIESMVDAHIMSQFLPAHTRSIVFRNRCSISELYPMHLRPFFFYINVGVEIGRVEIPAWVAQDNDAVDYIAQVVLDQ